MTLTRSTGKCLAKTGSATQADGRRFQSDVHFIMRRFCYTAAKELGVISACSSGHLVISLRFLFFGGRLNLARAALAVRLWNMSAYWFSTPNISSLSVIVLSAASACFKDAASYSYITLPKKLWSTVLMTSIMNWRSHWWTGSSGKYCCSSWCF